MKYPLSFGASIIILISTHLVASTFIEPGDYPGELCNRQCVDGDNRICYFQFTLEYYQAMGVACGGCGRGNDADCDNPQCIVGDGVEKGVMSINRQVPGPAIQVCKGDYIIVDVVNHAHGSAAAIHWHGLHMRQTPSMDGVPFVTQCPIPFSTSFRYQFWATEPGTHFYHSHSGHHKVNGQYGALIVRATVAEMQNADKYDFDLSEHYILISDWMHSYGEQFFPGLPSSSGICPNSVLINGRGMYTDPESGERTSVPPTVYTVAPGRRYRFRVINSISHACPFQLQVQQHSLTVIASDSYNVEPHSFDTLVTNSGERYDFVLTANHTDGDFLIRVRGLGLCATNPTESFAILRYASNDVVDILDATHSKLPPNIPSYTQPYAPGHVLNHPNAICFDQFHEHCVTELNAMDEDEALRKAQPDYKFFLAFHNYAVPNEEVFQPGRYGHFVNPTSNSTIVGAISNLSLVFPSSPPLTQSWDMRNMKFCDEFHWPEECNGKRLCPCVHRLEIRLNSIVELVIVDESESVGIFHHPFHLHGYRFMVTALGQHPIGVPMTVKLAQQMDRSRTLVRHAFNERPPFKDTVSIPSRGFAVVRFKADNPGFWLMHCHYEWHLAIGMGLILQVGQPIQMVRTPLAFPRCGNYLPHVLRPRFKNN